MLHRLAALVAATALTGCSFFLTSSPPERTNPPSPIPPNCTTEKTWPVVDTIISVASILAVLGTISQGKSSTSSSQDTGSAIAGSVILAGAAGAGAYVGFGRVKNCRVAQNEFAASFYRNGGQPVPGQPYAVPGVQPNNTGVADAPDYTPQQPRAYKPQGPYAPPPARPLATEGDVCNAEVVCGLGLVCASNICVVPPKR
jgi:hypothetical protein